MENTNYGVELLNITKKFGKLTANDNITLRVKKGEIHALLGENGAGKSTLMNILFGIYPKDEGLIKVNGEEAFINNPADTEKYKIGMVHQHFKLVDDFTVLENIILGRERQNKLRYLFLIPIFLGFIFMFMPLYFKSGFSTIMSAFSIAGIIEGFYFLLSMGVLDKSHCRKEILEICNRYNMKLDLDKKVSKITVGQQQRVEIVKMLYRKAEVLIFDEPSAVLSPDEIENLLELLKNFANEGKPVILITHKLNEIKACADKCSILRKGKYIGTYDVDKTSTDKLAELMVGKKVSFKTEKVKQVPGKKVLEVENLTKVDKKSSKPLLNDISFSVKQKEIVCIAGIDGNGQSELIKAITGIDKKIKGKIFLEEEDITKTSIKKRFRKGMSHIPEDRQKEGLIMDYNLFENVISNQYEDRRFQKFGFLRKNIIINYTNELIDLYDVRSANGAYSISKGLSGGNQQKLIIARETNREHNFLIASQPTRGLDVGAIEFVHKTLIKERDSGKAILVISFELDEVFNLADRILVMFEGEIVAELDPAKTSEKEISLYMSGFKKMNFRGEL